MANKKIMNATQVTECGISFKSKSEQMIYNTLIQLGYHPEYEKTTYLVWEGFVPKVTFITKNTFKRKDYRIEKIGTFSVKDNRPLQGITYTPDFEFDAFGKHIIIEVKGFMNDLAPYKMKMFRKLLEEDPNKDNIEYWEIHSKKQLLECLNHLQQSAGMSQSQSIEQTQH